MFKDIVRGNCEDESTSKTHLYALRIRQNAIEGPVEAKVIREDSLEWKAIHKAENATLANIEDLSERLRNFEFDREKALLARHQRPGAKRKSRPQIASINDDYTALKLELNTRRVIQERNYKILQGEAPGVITLGDDGSVSVTRMNEREQDMWEPMLALVEAPCEAQELAAEAYRLFLGTEKKGLTQDFQNKYANFVQQNPNVQKPLGDALRAIRSFSISNF